MSVKDPSLKDGLSLTFQTRLNTSAPTLLAQGRY